MNIEEIKFLLSAYRKDLSMEDAPEMTEALQHLQNDAKLAAWYEKEKAFDLRIGAALGAIPVPEDLNARLLDSFAAEVPLPNEAKVVPFPRRRLLRWSAAALFVIAASLIKYFAFPPPVQFPRDTFVSVDAFREDMAHFANNRFVLDYTTKDLEKAKQWLVTHQSPSYAQTPSAIVEYRGMGCKSFDWGEHKVSLVCFKNDDNEIVHLFVLNRASLQQLQPASPLNEVHVRHNLETGGWIDAQHVYMLVGSEPGVKIGDILADAI